MRIPDAQLDTAIFICVDEETSPGITQRTPMATAFITVIKGEPFFWTAYVVTAAHNLEGVGDRPFYLRFNTDNGFDDIQTRREDWFIHDRADVALTRVKWGTYNIHAIYPEHFIDANYCFQETGPFGPN